MKKGNPQSIEEKVNAYWDRINILKKTIEEREESPNFVFYEGPPTANNLPGIHHVISRDLKDIASLVSPALAGGYFATSTTWEALSGPQRSESIKSRNVCILGKHSPLKAIV